MIKLGPGMVGAPSWSTEGETQVLIDAPTQLHLSGGGLEYAVPVKSITLGDTFSATDYSYIGESVTLNALSALTFSGNGITGTVRPNHVILGSGMTGWYTGGNLYLYATGGGGTPLPIGDPNSVLASNGSSNFWDDFPTVNGVSTQTVVVRPESSGQNHTVRQSGDKLVDYTSSIGGTVGSYAISATPYDADSSNAPRHTKLFGSFVLNGPSDIKNLVFASVIDGASVPAESNISGTFLLGWRSRRSGSPYSSGTIQFLISIKTDASGNLSEFRTGVTGANYATPSTGYNFTISAADLESSMSILDGAVPCSFSIAIHSNNFWIECWHTSGAGASDIDRYYWEINYGWGTTA